MPTALTVMPEKITAGVTIDLTRSHADYPANDGWALALHIFGPDATVTVNGVASGAAFTFAVSAADTGRTPGLYTWIERASKAGKVYDAASGTLQILPNPATQTAGSGQTWEEKTLTVVEAVLSGRITNDIESYQIAGRAVTKIPIPELMRIRGRLAQAVRLQRTGQFSTPIHVTFPPVGMT